MAFGNNPYGVIPHPQDTEGWAERQSQMEMDRYEKAFKQSQQVHQALQRSGYGHHAVVAPAPKAPKRVV